MSQGPIEQQLQKLKANRHDNSNQLAGKRVKSENWIGFKEKTLWDWMNLIAALLVPVVIATGSIWFSAEQSATSIRIAQDQQQETVLKTYMDDIKDLLLHEGLLEEKKDEAGKSHLRTIATTLTFSALRQLDGDRKGRLMLFISSLNLIDRENTVIELARAGLSGAYHTRADLREADLEGADIGGTNLEWVVLSEANLESVGLHGGNLTGADLTEANMTEADMTKANLYHADLKGTNLSGAVLLGTNLSMAFVSGISLVNAQVTPKQLSVAFFLYNITLPDGSKFPSKTWPIPGRDERCIYLQHGMCFDYNGEKTKEMSIS